LFVLHNASVVNCLKPRHFLSFSSGRTLGWHRRTGALPMRVVFWCRDRKQRVCAEFTSKGCPEEHYQLFGTECTLFGIIHVCRQTSQKHALFDRFLATNLGHLESTDSGAGRWGVANPLKGPLGGSGFYKSCTFHFEFCI